MNSSDYREIASVRWAFAIFFLVALTMPRMGLAESTVNSAVDSDLTVMEPWDDDVLNTELAEQTGDASQFQGSSGSGYAPDGSMQNTPPIRQPAMGLSCHECIGVTTPNLFFGKIRYSESLIYFFILMVGGWILTVYLFYHRIVQGGDILRAFWLSIGVLLIWGYAVGLISFSQYFLDSCWCEGMSMQIVDSGIVRWHWAALKSHLNWRFIFLVLFLTIGLMMMVRIFVRPKPITHQPQQGSN